MFSTRRVLFVVLALAAGTALPGCIRKKKDTAPDDPQAGAVVQTGPASTARGPSRTAGILGVRERVKVMNELREIGKLYLSSERPPSKEEFLADSSLPNGYRKLIEDEYYVIFWGVDVSKLPQGASNTVLAYEYPDTAGSRHVLMADGTVQVMNADQFAKAPKAGKVK